MKQELFRVVAEDSIVFGKRKGDDPFPIPPGNFNIEALIAAGSIERVEDSEKGSK